MKELVVRDDTQLRRLEKTLAEFETKSPTEQLRLSALITSLVILSIVKFLFVIFYFMHLRWDKAFCTILFFIGLVLAGGTVWALLRIFSMEERKPLTSEALNGTPSAYSTNLS